LLQIPIFQWFHQTTFQNQQKKKCQFESGKEDLQNKPERDRNKIVEGRIEESKKQVLLDQEYIRDPNITVDEYIKQVVGILGENIRVARFTLTY
jgi:elongation factor Ts